MKNLIILITNFFKILKINFSKSDYIFYSEKLFYKNYYFDFFKALSKYSNKCYIMTSDINEYFELNKNKEKVFFIGDGIIKIIILNIVNCSYFLTTMPGIGNNIKKSINCKNYVYFFHALASTHKIYKDKSFDNFDIILTNGEYQKKELEERFSIKNITKKIIYNTGYFYLDYLKNHYQADNENYILFAPSWNYDKKNLFNDFGIKIINQLLEKNHKVIFRPHPEIIKRNYNLYLKTVHNFTNNKNLLVDLDSSNINSLKKSSIIITDNSSIGLEFGLIFYRPTIYINYKDKIHNNEFKLIKSEPLEKKFEEKFGHRIKSSDIENLSYICKNIKNLDKSNINEFIIKNLSNFGNSIDKAVKFILSKNKNCI